MGRRGNGEGEIERLPSGKFRARRSRMIGGELVRSSKTFVLRKDAVNWLGENASPTRAGTLGEWLDTWLALIKPDRAPSGYRYYNERVRRSIRPKLGPLKLRDLTSLAIVRFLAQLDEDDVSPTERAKVGRVLRTALNAAVAHKQIPANPMTGVKLPKSEGVEKRSMTAEELAKVIRSAEPRGLSAVCRLWADAGLRPGEMFALEWADIDLDLGTLKVCRGLDAITNTTRTTKTKGSKRRIVLAPSTVRELVAARPVNASLVLPNADGGHFWQSNFHKQEWKPIREAAGLDWITPYTFRHTMATLLLRAGVPLKVVSERLGHASVSITLTHYAHVLDGDQDRASAAMEGILNPVPHPLPTDAEKT